MIGAGSSGLAALRALVAQDLDATCFEQGHDVGGLWVKGNSNGRKGAYASLHINTSKDNTQFSDFPMPEELGDFPHHSELARYFRSYAEHFDLLDRIRFGRQVKRCIPLESGGYELTLTEERETSRFDAIVVANGHHFQPHLPEPTTYATFDGEVIHSYDYESPTTPLDFRSRRVLVVGIGNSAVDIACELSRSGASRVILSARRGAWVMPKYLRGQPIDGPAFFPHFLPGKLRRILVTQSFRWIYGSMNKFGLPEPDHLIGEAHPTISSDLPHLVKSGQIQVRPGFAFASDRCVLFADGSTEDVDAIVFCTGYQVAFPFFDPEHIAARKNELPLFFRTFHPEHRNVFFVGLLQTIGAVMPVAEAQARAIALHLCGEYNLPDAHSMFAHIQESDEKMKTRFVPSLRHTMQVIPEHFHPALKRELREGKRRARRREGIAFSAGMSTEEGAPP